MKARHRIGMTVVGAVAVLVAGCVGPEAGQGPDTQVGTTETTLPGATEPGLAVTVPTGPDEPVRVTIPPSTTSTTMPPQDIRIIPSDLLFAVDSAVLSSGAEPVLAAILPDAVAASTSTLVIAGHTDADGSEDYNQDLSVRRAQAVAQWFTGHQVLAEKISIHGRGESQPVAPNDTPEGKAKNRRVEITVRSDG